MNAELVMPLPQQSKEPSTPLNRIKEVIGELKIFHFAQLTFETTRTLAQSVVDVDFFQPYKPQIVEKRADKQLKWEKANRVEKDYIAHTKETLDNIITWGVLYKGGVADKHASAGQSVKLALRVQGAVMFAFPYLNKASEILGKPLTWTLLTKDTNSLSPELKVKQKAMQDYYDCMNIAQKAFVSIQRKVGIKIETTLNRKLETRRQEKEAFDLRKAFYTILGEQISLLNNHEELENALVGLKQAGMHIDTQLLEENADFITKDGYPVFIEAISQLSDKEIVSAEVPESVKENAAIQFALNLYKVPILRILYEKNPEANISSANLETIVWNLLRTTAFSLAVEAGNTTLVDELNKLIADDIKGVKTSLEKFITTLPQAERSQVEELLKLFDPIGGILNIDLGNATPGAPPFVRVPVSPTARRRAGSRPTPRSGPAIAAVGKNPGLLAKLDRTEDRNIVFKQFRKVTKLYGSTVLLNTLLGTQINFLGNMFFLEVLGGKNVLPDVLTLGQMSLGERAFFVYIVTAISQLVMSTPVQRISTVFPGVERIWVIGGFLKNWELLGGPSSPTGDIGQKMRVESFYIHTFDPKSRVPRPLIVVDDNYEVQWGPNTKKLGDFTPNVEIPVDQDDFNREAAKVKCPPIFFGIRVPRAKWYKLGPNTWTPLFYQKDDTGTNDDITIFEGFLPHLTIDGKPLFPGEETRVFFKSPLNFADWVRDMAKSVFRISGTSTPMGPYLDRFYQLPVDSKSKSGRSLESGYLPVTVVGNERYLTTDQGQPIMQRGARSFWLWALGKVADQQMSDRGIKPALLSIVPNTAIMLTAIWALQVLERGTNNPHAWQNSWQNAFLITILPIVTLGALPFAKLMGTKNSETGEDDKSIWHKLISWGIGSVAGTNEVIDIPSSTPTPIPEIHNLVTQHIQGTNLTAADFNFSLDWLKNNNFPEGLRNFGVGDLNQIYPAVHQLAQGGSQSVNFEPIPLTATEILNGFELLQPFNYGSNTYSAFTDGSEVISALSKIVGEDTLRVIKVTYEGQNPRLIIVAEVNGALQVITEMTKNY